MFGVVWWSDDPGDEGWSDPLVPACLAQVYLSSKARLPSLDQWSFYPIPTRCCRVLLVHQNLSKWTPTSWPLLQVPQQIHSSTWVCRFFGGKRENCNGHNWGYPMFKHTNLIMANKKSKACENTCKVHDVLVGVCRHVLSGNIFHPGPIRIQFP